MSDSPQGAPIGFPAATFGSVPVPVAQGYDPLAAGAAEVLTVEGVNIDGIAVTDLEILAGINEPANYPTLTSVLFTAGVRPDLDKLAVTMNTTAQTGGGNQFYTLAMTKNGQRAFASFNVFSV